MVVKIHSTYHYLHSQYWEDIKLEETTLTEIQWDFECLDAYGYDSYPSRSLSWGPEKVAYGQGYARWMYRSWLCRKNLQGCRNGGHPLREIVQVIQSILNNKWWVPIILILLPRQKKAFLVAFRPRMAHGPGISTVSSALINGTFIYKHKLVGLVSAYASCKICSFLNTTFNCDARELWNS